MAMSIGGMMVRKMIEQYERSQGSGMMVHKMLEDNQENNTKNEKPEDKD